MIITYGHVAWVGEQTDDETWQLGHDYYKTLLHLQDRYFSYQAIQRLPSLKHVPMC